MRRIEAREPVTVPRNLEEEFLLMVSSLTSDDPNVQAKKKEFGTFNFEMKETTEGLDLVSGIEDKIGETYHGFVLVLPLTLS